MLAQFAGPALAAAMSVVCALRLDDFECIVARIKAWCMRGARYCSCEPAQMKNEHPGMSAAAPDALPEEPRSPEEQTAKLRALRTALIEGERSGPPTRFDFDAFIARKRRERQSRL
jgi:antitoxin ParD1/3/4